jgi:hypothetical protein
LGGKITFYELHECYRYDKNFLKRLLSENGMMYEFIHEKFHNDAELFLIAFKNNPNIIKFIPKILKELIQTYNLFL